MGRFLLAAVALFVVLAPGASAQAPVFVQFPDIDILVGEQHFDTPPRVPKVGDKLWGNNGSPFCDPVCDPNHPSQQPQSFQTLLPGNGSPPSGQFFSWRRCTGGGCLEVKAKSTTDNTYVVQPEDAGAKLQFVVSLTNYDCGEVVRGGPDAGKQECRWTTVSATAITETVQQTAVVAISPESLAEGQAGVPYSQSLAATGGTGPASFAVTTGTLPPGLTLSPGGQLTGTPTTAGSYTFTVQATAPGANPGSRTYTVGVGMVLPAGLADGVTGVPFSLPLAAVGAPGAVTWSVASGALPDGLALAGAQIAGTPTKQGEFSLTLNAASGAVSAAKQYTIKIAYPPVVIGCDYYTPCTRTGPLELHLASALRGRLYEAELTADGGTGPYTFGLLEGSLPRGLSLKANGEIFGTPRATTTGVQVLRLKLQVHDKYGAPGEAALQLGYYGPVLTLAPKRLVLPAGGTFRTVLEPGGGAAPYTFELVGGKLPKGVKLGKRGAVVAKRPAVATRRLAIRVRDRLGGFGVFRVKLEVKPVTSIAIP